MPRSKVESRQRQQGERGQNGGRHSSWRDIRSGCPSPSQQLRTNQAEPSSSPPVFLISVNDTIIYPIVQLKNPTIIFDFSLKASPPTSCWLCLQKPPHSSSPLPSASLQRLWPGPGSSHLSGVPPPSRPPPLLSIL